MKIRVKVTQAHIDRGQSCLVQDCPVALATHEGLPPNYRLVAVTNYKIHIVSPAGKDLAIDTPIEVANYIDRLDNYGETGQPFEFELEI